MLYPVIYSIYINGLKWEIRCSKFSKIYSILFETILLKSKPTANHELPGPAAAEQLSRIIPIIRSAWLIPNLNKTPSELF
jgi:hypothetical protein